MNPDPPSIAPASVAPRKIPPSWLPEAVGIIVLGALLASFLDVSWRRWPDPIVDSGPQWYAAWRVSQGAPLFGDFLWNYGPFSAYFNAFVFKTFGVSLTVLFTTNLLVYGGILVLAYLAFRRAWGRLGAFAACGAFISVFSFSILNSIGNYNYGSPYAHEAAHGILLLFVTIFAAARWMRGASTVGALLLGTCGGIAAVLKPEFMLAAGALGFAALVLRFGQKKFPTMAEWALLVIGVAWPTLAFTAAFAMHEPFAAAFAHASNAWWVVLVKPVGAAGFSAGMQQLAGLDHSWLNAWLEIKAGLCALAVAAILTQNFRLPPAIHLTLALIIVPLVLGLIWVANNPLVTGRCFPLLTAAIFIFVCVRLWRTARRPDGFDPARVMQLMLALAAGVMLARMALLSRIDHFGFFQAALAGMVAAAFLTAEALRHPQRIAGVAGAFVVLLFCCGSIARKSNAIHRDDQTQPVGSAEDRFLAFDRAVDPTGTLVNWAAQKLSETPPGSTAVVVPDGWLSEISEGISINFLARRVSPIPDVVLGSSEEALVERLDKAAPDYIVEISHNLPSGIPKKYGAPGNAGALVVPWITNHYDMVAEWGEPFSGTRARGARILGRKIEATKNPLDATNHRAGLIPPNNTATLK